jgi:spore coat polysaccharide biosynthesis protein SpsF
LIGAIIQARMGSTRLPGKIMLPVLDKPILEHLVDRVKKSSNIDEIIIATSINKNDDIIEIFCKSQKIKCFRGSEKDVLLRYFEAAKKFSIDIIVRLTSDTPLLDPKIIDKVILKYNENKYDYVSNFFPLPRTYPDGYNVEIFSMELLEQTNIEAKKPSDREHVTTFITMQPKKFKKYRVDSEKDLSKYRLNLDYKEDFELIKSVLEKFDEKANLDDIINWLDKHPEILKLNSHIKPYENLLKSFEQDKKLGYEPYEKNFYIESTSE